MTSKWQQAQERIQQILGLKTAPVGVFLDKAAERGLEFSGWRLLKKHRYCQALMRARNGERVILEPDELSCPAAAGAFGFRPLPEGLKSGKGLVGFGIVEKPETGKTMFAEMPHFYEGALRRIELCPLGEAPDRPDVIVVEALTEQLMWLLLADLRAAGGSRRLGDTAVLQATCVDATLVPFIENRLNFSYGCYGCREATDIGEGEAVLGFPSRKLAAILDNLEDLGDKAIPNSRAKKAYQRLEEDNDARCG
jgi:uncharacterized protein (DUF169 family)